MTVVSIHKNRVVREEGDLFVKEFATRRLRDDELKRLRWLEAAGVGIPEIVGTEGTLLVTKRLPGRPLDALIAARWPGMPRAEKNEIIRRVAEVCTRIRDAGYDWPDLVSYHLYLSSEEVRVLDPARLRNGRLDLSALYWSLDEPVVTRTDRLRFWRAYAGKRKPQRIRRIGHRGRFRPYRWVFQRDRVRACLPWAAFVNNVDAPYASADEVAAKAKPIRTLEDRVNANLGDLVVKILKDPGEAETEWENTRTLMAAGFRVPTPAVGGLLKDGRALFSTVRLDGLDPMDDVWATLDPRRALRAAADVARRLHAGGLVHKDLYLCHLFVAKGGEEITLIDLARITRTRSRRLRVKDLAALYVSAKDLASRTDLLRALKRYGGGRPLARAVLRKAARMARHVPKNVRDGTHVPHVPRL